ncbi:unnamed protein product [Linum trigynum]|uniref:RNase H type-1 domain-containing protein n=1 Tax=Linum trigynum TaxID=586398 RepID=A0AAV2G8E2_9ROSI
MGDLARACRWLDEYLEAQRKGEPAAEEAISRWSPSATTEFTINVEAACLTDQGTGLGVMVRDKKGAFCLAAIKRTRRCWDPELAESMAVDFGIDLADQYHFLASEIQTDCQTVERMMRGERQSKLEVGRVCDETKKRASEMGRFVWKFVGRKLNEPTHIVAHLDCDWEGERIWVDSTPNSIGLLLQNEASVTDFSHN